ncbi:MAG: class I SAM-dependent methyltransferase [Thermoleophilia bacterium]|nr:class I SAM-dependent methyltransferase [Thermoleophilia bacterium]
MSDEPSWSEFYDRVADRPPHETVVGALDRFEREGRRTGFAVDLGCGDGRDAAELARRGWRVLAIDAEEEAIERLRARPGLEAVETLVARFEEATWPRADLVNAGFSLAFCAPEHFGEVWRRIVESLRPAGRFSGQLFGDRDGWAGDAEMTFVTRSEAESLFAGFELERFDEVDEDGHLVTGAPKHWHVFHVVAKRA